MKGLKISYKLGGSFFIIIIAMIITGISSTSSIMRVSALNEEVTELNEDIAFFVEKEVDHLRWLNDLNSMIVSGSIPESVTHQECDLGQWYYSNELDGNYREAFLALEEPHITAHESSIRAIEAFERGDVELASSIIQSETAPAVASVQAELDNLQAISRENAEVILSQASQVERDSIRFSLVFLAVAIAISVFLAYILNSNIVGPLKKVVHELERVSNYDLVMTENDDIYPLLSRNDEVGNIARILIQMQENLIVLINQINEASQSVMASSQELTATSQQSSIASRELSKTIEEISHGASDQANDTERGVGYITELGSLIDKDESLIKELISASDIVTDLKEEGMTNLKDMVEKTGQTIEATDKVTGTVKNTNEGAKRIQEASTMIKSIAEQTNLLALNAAIESARAGEAGKGFAVVAEEIRKLAEQSSKFTEEINTIVTELNETTAEAVDTMELVGEVVASQSESVNVTNEKFEGIDKAIQQVREWVSQLNEAGEVMVEKKDEIITIMESLSAISEENAAGSEEASASVEEQEASMEEIELASETLSQLAEEMQTTISNFKY